MFAFQGNEPVARKKIDATPLRQTRQASERLREIWLAAMAKGSSEQGWGECDIVRAALEGALGAALGGNIKTKSTAEELMRQGRLAAHPAVREHYDSLVDLRDRSWSAYRELMGENYHGPSQALVDMLGCQSRPNDRHHVADIHAYVRYLQARRSSRP